jgi:hypothetical protein
MSTFRYVCMSLSCGFIELTGHAPLSSKPCPRCGGQLRRERA